jgi:hypothetical protein
MSQQINAYSRSAAQAGIPETSGWTVEALRSRVFFKMMDAVLTAPLHPRQTIRALLRAIFSVHSSHYTRVASTINLADQVIPGTSQRISNSLVSPTQLPLAVRSVSLMSYGSGSTVFLLDTPIGTLVLKIFRRSLGKKGLSLFNVADEFQAKYRTVSRWFNHAGFQLVPPAIFLILHGPLLGKPAAATLQPFITGEKKDLFLDFQDDELLHLFQSDPKLRQEFVFFACNVLEMATVERLCPDFIGRDNVLLVRVDADCRLAVIDNGIFNLEHLKITRSAVYTQIESYFERLRQLLLALNIG